MHIEEDSKPNIETGPTSHFSIREIESKFRPSSKSLDMEAAQGQGAML